MKIAVIEDNPTHLDLIVMILKSYGITNVVTAEDGMHGYQLVLDEKPDLVLLDLDLPIANGFQVAANLRFEAGYADLPIIAVTSSNPRVVHEKALQSGFDDVVSKHSLKKELPELLEDFLNEAVAGE
ncbi:MAG: response regulator [Chloroflexi bacterium]|nr:response regulator [Chloroflexota bacterium]